MSRHVTQKKTRGEANTRVVYIPINLAFFLGDVSIVVSWSTYPFYRGLLFVALSVLSVEVISWNIQIRSILRQGSFKGDGFAEFMGDNPGLRGRLEGRAKRHADIDIIPARVDHPVRHSYCALRNGPHRTCGRVTHLLSARNFQHLKTVGELPKTRQCLSFGFVCRLPGARRDCRQLGTV